MDFRLGEKSEVLRKEAREFLDEVRGHRSR